MLLRHCFLVSSLLLAAGPAASMDVAFLAPADVPAEHVRAAAPPLSAPSLAVKAALAELSNPGEVRELELLESVRSFYASRDFAPVWLGGREPSPQMAALRERMADARADGLDPAPYATSEPTVRGLDAARAEADIAFSLAVARFVTHLSAGRLTPAEISSIITLHPEAPPAGDVLAQLSTAEDIAAALAGYEPPHDAYRALRAKLAELQESKDGEERVVVPEGELLKPGQDDSRVPALRRRLALSAPDAALTDFYDIALVDAVKAFQEENGLTADGILGPRTLVALNGRSPEEDIAAIVANLERWRWMPRDLGAFHVMVNVPEFMVRVVEDGAVTHQTRVVVGTPENRTPTFSHDIDHLVVNPFWNVPASIVAEEMMPAVRRNPGYFSRGGYQVFARVGGRTRQINPYWVDWYRVSPRAIQVRQVPGDFNALGRIKFMFPNQHSVYLHDTPSKKLFQRDDRALSHGCVRVENPLAFADAILPVAAPEWNSGRIEKLYGGKERRINLDNPVPVHLAYFTMAVEADGELRRFEDIYGYDEETTALMQSQPEG